MINKGEREVPCESKGMRANMSTFGHPTVRRLYTNVVK